MNLRNRKIHIGRYTISAILLMLIIGTGAVFAVAYVALQWTANVTVAANPKVSFIKWQDGSKVNTFTYSVNIFPNIKTVDENITYGVWNWDSSAHTIYFRLASENTNSTDITWLYYKVYDGGTLYSRNETDFNNPTTTWSSGVSAAAITKYTIWMEIKAGSSAGVGHTPSVTFEMKVENP